MRYAIGSAIATAIIYGALIITGGTPPAPPLGTGHQPTWNIGTIRYVSNTGSGSTCTTAAPCGSFDQAYRTANPGDTVMVRCNGGGACTYPTQTIFESSKKPLTSTCRYGTTFQDGTVTENVSGCIHFIPETGSQPTLLNFASGVPYVALDSFNIGTPGNSDGDISALNRGGQPWPGDHAGAPENGSGNGTCQSPNFYTDMIFINDLAHRFTFQGLQYVSIVNTIFDSSPPNNSSNQVENCWPRQGNPAFGGINDGFVPYQMNHLLFDHTTIHDMQFFLVGQHVEGIHWYSCSYCYITGMVQKNVGQYGIFFDGDRDNISNVTIENSVFDLVCSHPNPAQPGQCQHAIDFAHRDTRFTMQNNIVRFNSFNLTDGGVYFSSAGTQNSAHVYGNIMKGPPDSTSCNNYTSYGVVMDYNVFASGSTACGATNSTSATNANTYVDPPSYDYQLLNCSTATANEVPTNVSGGIPATDITGRPRPDGTAADAGAYEQCGSIISPQLANFFIDQDGGSCTGQHGGANLVVYNTTTACASADAAYQAASPGDIVKIESGTYPDQTILAAHAKPLVSTCRWGGPFLTGSTTQGTTNEAQNLSGCIQFAPDMNATISLSNLDIQVPYVYLNGLTLTGAHDGTHGRIEFTDKSATCSTGAWTDFIVRNVIAQGFDLKGASHVYFINTTYDNQSNTPSTIEGCNQFNGGTVGQYNHMMLDGMLLKNNYYSTPTHTEGIHWYGGDFVTVRNSIFLNNALNNISQASEAESVIQTNHWLVENNIFDATCSHQFWAQGCTSGINSPGGAAGPPIQLESSGSVLARFNTFWDSGPTNTDFIHMCDVRSRTPCPDMRSTGNLMGPMQSFQCTNVFSATIYEYNIFTMLPGTSTGGCGANSIIPTVEQLKDNPNFNYALNNCSVASVNAIPTSVAGGIPSTDILGNPRSGNADAGAFDQCPATGFGTGGSTATCPQNPCGTGVTSNIVVTTTDGAGKAVDWNSKIYTPASLAGPAPLLIYYGGAQDTQNPEDWVGLANRNRVRILWFWTHPGFGTYNYKYLNPSQQNFLCGTSGTALCDDTIALVDTINYVKANYPVDATKLYGMGDSKGGTMTRETMCAPNTNPLFRGFAPASSSPQSSYENGPINCTALANGNRDFSYMMVYGDQDSFGMSTGPNKVCAGPNTAIIEPGCFDSARQRWVWAPTAGTNEVRKDFGCLDIPITTTTGPTGKLVRTVYPNCKVANRAVALMKVVTGTHAYGGMLNIDGYDPGEDSYLWLSTH